MAPMEVPTPDPSKLLQSWMEWERGEVTPGRVMANMKTGGLRLLLEGLSAPGGASSAGPGDTPVPAVPELSGPDPATGSADPGASRPYGEPGTIAGPPSTWAPVV